MLLDMSAMSMAVLVHVRPSCSVPLPWSWSEVDLMLEVDSLFEVCRADQDATRPLAPH